MYFIISCTQQADKDRFVVDEEREGAIVLTMITDSIETAWDQMQDAHGNTVNYSAFYIREGTDKTNYMLMSNVWDGEVKTQTGTELELIDGVFCFLSSEIKL